MVSYIFYRVLTTNQNKDSINSEELFHKRKIICKRPLNKQICKEYFILYLSIKSLLYKTCNNPHCNFFDNFSEVRQTRGLQNIAPKKLTWFAYLMVLNRNFQLRLDFVQITPRHHCSMTK